MQDGVRVKLPPGVTWDEAGRDDARRRSATKDLFPAGFLPLPHPNQPRAAWSSRKFHIDEIKRRKAAT